MFAMECGFLAVVTVVEVVDDWERVAVATGGEKKCLEIWALL